MRSIILLLSLALLPLTATGQSAPLNWYLLDPQTDGVYGAGVTRAYALLGDRPVQEVIVAVIDAGVEVDHEDLQGVMWTNPGEVAGNGIDDDGNGYIDDVHGWSYLGGPGGDIEHEALELARIVQDMGQYFNGKDTEALTEKDQQRFDRYQQWVAIFNTEQAKLNQQYVAANGMLNIINAVKAQNGGEFSRKAIKKYDPENRQEKGLKTALYLMALFMDESSIENEMRQGVNQLGPLIEYNTMDTDSIRSMVVGDDPDNGIQTDYGCNRVEGPDALHGTHVSGIIAAQNGNSIGIEGIAKNARIMALRAVPNGDERDKDVANAIRYAVDNGAKVINMSFGKQYSPQKSLVDDAVKYALEKDVLLVHAAGNESIDNDQVPFFPNRHLDNGVTVPNWLEVGANSSSRKKKKLLATFSNYGATTVDLFAPGVDIYSTVTDNGYEDASGTSMASPTAAGVAALIRGYFPDLTAAEVRELLIRTSEPVKGKVRIPGGKAKARMSELCISGGVIHAENAVRELLGNSK